MTGKINSEFSRQLFLTLGFRNLHIRIIFSLKALLNKNRLLGIRTEFMRKKNRLSSISFFIQPLNSNSK